MIWLQPGVSLCNSLGQKEKINITSWCWLFQHIQAMVDQHGNHTASFFFGRTLWHWKCMTAVPEMSGIQRGWRIPRVALAVLAGEAPTLWSVGTSFGKQGQFLFQNKWHKCCIWLISSRRLALHHLSISHAKLHRPCLGCRWKFLQGHKPSLPPSIKYPQTNP